MLKSLGKSVLIYGLASSISKFIGILLIPIYSLYFSKEEYGSLDIISTIISFIAILGMLQLESAIGRFYYEVEGRKRRIYISTAFWTIIVLSLIAVMLTVIFSDFISFQLFDNYKYSLIFRLASINILLFNVFGFLTVLIRFKNKPLFYSLVVFIQFLLTGLISTVLIVYYNYGILAFFIGQIFGLLVGAIIMLVYMRDSFVLKFDLSVLIMFFKYSLPQVPATAGNWLNSYVNRFVMLGYLSVSDIGIYTVGLKIASIFNLIDSAFRMAWEPFVWDLIKKAEYKEKLNDLANIITILIFLVGIIFVLFAEEIQVILSTDEYIDSLPIIKMLILAFCFPIISQVAGIGISISKKTFYLTISYFIGVLLNIIMLFILVPLYGLKGVPLSLIISNVIILLLMWFFAERLHKINYNKKVIITTLILGSISILTLINYNFNLFFRLTMGAIILITIYLSRNKLKAFLPK